MQLIVVGGGCFGTLQTSRLLKAMDRGVIDEQRILVVDRNGDHRARRALSRDPRVSFVTMDWSDFLREYFSAYAQGAGDRIVPAHLAPHLLFEAAKGAVAGAGSRTVTGIPVDVKFGLPFEKGGAGGIRYISAAAWLCPFACIEPETCPATRGARDWDLSTLVPGRMEGAADRCFVFKTTHFAWGVGTIECDTIASAFSSIRQMAASSRGTLRVAIATTSNCHGVVGMLQIS